MDCGGAHATAAQDLRYYTGAIDGDFGVSTETAVKAFQMVNGLTVDGVAGDSTLSRICATTPSAPTQHAVHPAARRW